MAAAYLGDTFRAMSRATCLAMLCALHASALGSPRSDPTQGRAVFTGAATPNPTSIDVNPAALGLGIPDELYIAATAGLDHLSIDRRELDIDNGALTDGESVSGNLLSPGGMIAGVWHSGVSGRVTLGVALHSSPAERWLEDKEALRYHTLGGSHRVYAGSVASSFRLSGRVYLGIGLSIHTSVLQLKYARDTALAAGRDPARGIDSYCGGSPCGVENPAAAERYTVDVRSAFVALDNVVATVGVIVRLADDVWLGVSYHTPPGLSIQNELSGTMEVQRAPRDGGETLTGAATVYISQPASFDLELTARLLPDLDLHVGSRLDDTSRMQAYDVRGYGSFFPAASIPEWQLRPRGFHEGLRRFTVASWAGVEQAGRDSPLALGGRVGFETSALPDERTAPMTIAPTSLTFDAGVQYRFTRDVQATPQVTLLASYGLQYFPTVDVTDSDYDPRAQLACEDSGFDYSTEACAAVRNGYAIPTAAGEYSRIQQAARVALRLTW
jgi:hypothetical protein